MRVLWTLDTMQHASPSPERERRRLMQIESIAVAERVGSIQFYVHIGLISLGSAVALLLYDDASFVIIGLLYVIFLSLEKLTAARAAQLRNTRLYALVLSLLAGRASLYALLVLSVWTNEGDIYKVAALALVMAATINIFVFHATYPEVIACVVVPIWLVFAALALLIGMDQGLSVDTIAAIIVFLAISPYVYMSLRYASDRWGEFDRTRVALGEAQKHDALGKLVSGVAHDFNNVMAITLATAEFLRDASEKEKDALVDEIVEAAERGASLSAQLLAFGRSSTLEPAAYDLEEVFENLRSMLGRVLPQNIETKVTVAPGLPQVFVDRYQLETALLNLVINARDAMPDGGTLRIDAAGMPHASVSPATKIPPGGDGSQICITVRDNGRGISKTIQSQVFDPFFTTKPVGEGSGLGLSMVHGFVGQSGGKVSLKSRPGKGTSIRLCLPAAAEKPAPRVPAKAKAAQPGEGQILLVEDEPALRRVLSHQLEMQGYVVTTASNGDDADRLLQSGFTPDVVVTDIAMPGRIQGDELTRILRKSHPRTPVICMSGYPKKPINSFTETETPDITLRKPIPAEELASAVQMVLQRVSY